MNRLRHTIVSGPQHCGKSKLIQELLWIAEIESHQIMHGLDASPSLDFKVLLVGESSAVTRFSEIRKILDYGISFRPPYKTKQATIRPSIIIESQNDLDFPEFNCIKLR